jgi:hypothetical protein
MEAWEELEEDVKELFKKDHVKTVPGSGNGKSEEDVIGISTIIQCKYTSNKNMSILDKDMTRLKEAARLQNKQPLFITKNNSGMVLSIPDGPLMHVIVDMIIASATINKMEEDIETCNDIGTYNIMSRFIESHMKQLTNTVETNIKHRYNHIKNRLVTIYNRLTCCDLFDEHH